MCYCDEIDFVVAAAVVVEAAVDVIGAFVSLCDFKTLKSSINKGKCICKCAPTS